MQNHLLKSIAVAITLCVGATVAQAQTVAGPHRPATVPEGYLITPFGYFHPSCVVHLNQWDELRPGQRDIRHSDGTTVAMHTCDYPHFKGDGIKVVGMSGAFAEPNISHSWIVSESVISSTAYGFLSAEWPVPPTPPSNDGQTLYYFNGLEDSKDVVTIIQPVLGWNGNGLSGWSIASWNCCESGTTYEGTPVAVSTGDTILGYMYDNCAREPRPAPVLTSLPRTCAPATSLRWSTPAISAKLSNGPLARCWRSITSPSAPITPTTPTAMLDEIRALPADLRADADRASAAPDRGVSAAKCRSTPSATTAIRASPFGGNKLRKLEYIVPDAIASKRRHAGVDRRRAIQSHPHGRRGRRQARHEMPARAGKLGAA